MNEIHWLGWIIALIFLFRSWFLPRRLEQARKRIKWLESEEIRQREIILRNAQELLAVMESGSEIVMLIQRPEFVISSGNMRSRRWLGWQGKPLPLSKLPISQKIISLLIQSTKSAPFETQIILAPGEILHHPNISAWHLESSIMHGNPFLIILRLRDVTQKYQDEQTRKDFVSNASHELRTPLTVVNGYLEMLLEEGIDLPNETQLRQILDKIFKNTQRLRGLVADMLTISRFESASSEQLNLSYFPLNECWQDILARLDFAIQQAHISISISLPKDQFEILGDLFYIDQIFYNLISNAIKYNENQELSIRLSAGITNDFWWAEVEDSGIGIPTESLPYIFNRFYRVDLQRSSKIEGTGLGLSIVKRGVEAHGGKISVSSEPRIRTIFRMEFPNKIHP